jgi:MurNAc alpha-1-phosphate uridylyltransferase
MLMAAGLGTRLRPFTLHEPKALLPVMGVPVAAFAVDSATRAGVQRIVANVHHLAERARAGLKGLERGPAELRISDESALLLGSAGGYRKALPLLGPGPFFALNADVLCDVDLARLWRQHQRLRSRFGVVMTLAVLRSAPSGEKYRRIAVDPATSLVTELVMTPEENPPFWAGVAVIEPEALSGVPEDQPAEFVPLVLRPAIESGRVGALVTSGQWHDIGSPELWLRTHLRLIGALETGALSAGWRRLIERRASRVESLQWVTRGGRIPAQAAGEWAGPCFWDGKGQAPRRFGPEAVLYGDAPSGRDVLGRGIGIAGVWAELAREG